MSDTEWEKTDVRSSLGDTCHVSPCREPMPSKNFSSHLSPHFVPNSVSAHLSVLRSRKMKLSGTTPFGIYDYIDKHENENFPLRFYEKHTAIYR